LDIAYYLRDLFADLNELIAFYPGDFYCGPLEVQYEEFYDPTT